MKNSYTYQELLDCSEGKLFGPGNCQLPKPPMLMFDRITHISGQGGQYNKGEIIAELDINPNLWFFACHFNEDPVMPGCLGVDAMWQLVGFFLGWAGGPGRGRALGSKTIKFSGQVLPTNKKVIYHINLSRIIKRRLFMGVGDGTMEVDGRIVYHTGGLKVGLFTDTGGF